MLDHITVLEQVRYWLQICLNITLDVRNGNNAEQETRRSVSLWLIKSVKLHIWKTSYLGPPLCCQQVTSLYVKCSH